MFEHASFMYVLLFGYLLEQPYDEVIDLGQLQDRMVQSLGDYNARSRKPMDLVMFMFAVEHVSRLARCANIGLREQTILHSCLTGNAVSRRETMGGDGRGPLPPRIPEGTYRKSWGAGESAGREFVNTNCCTQGKKRCAVLHLIGLQLRWGGYSWERRLRSLDAVNHTLESLARPSRLGLLMR